MYVHTYYKYYTFTIYMYSPDFLHILDYNDTKKGGGGWGGVLVGFGDIPLNHKEKLFFLHKRKRKYQETFLGWVSPGIHVHIIG